MHRLCSVLLGCSVALSMTATLRAQPARGVSRPLPALAWKTDAAEPQRFVAVHGREAAIFGYPGKGLEIWAYPLQILSGYRLSFHEQGSVEPIAGRQILRRVEYFPTRVVRIYVGPDFVVRETLFVPLRQPGVIVHYRVEGHAGVSIVVHFEPSLNLMWPGALGGQSTEWSAAVSGYVEQEPLYGYSATIASPEAVAHDTFDNPAIALHAGMALVLRPRLTADGNGSARLYVGLDAPHAARPATVRLLESDHAQLQMQARRHDREWLASSLRIETPDAEINRALAWAGLALDQAWVCNPQLGCGEAAGYGPSRPGRRPQYDWFFAGDGLVAVDGLVAAGDYDRAREELAFITKYQNPRNGMIWHELSQSAGLIDWRHKYPYMYVHVDTTFQYLAGVAAYAEASGDQEFVRAHWQNLAAAYRYCRSLISPSTHLPRIPAGKEGENEQVRMRDDIALSSAWVSAADSFARLAAMAGHASQAAGARQAAAGARAAIAARDWDAARHYWLQGHTAAGQPVFSQRARPSGILLQHVFSPRQTDEALDQLDSPVFLTDWGIRSMAAGSPGFDPDSYAGGSVSALGTADVAETFWREHRPLSAWELWYSLLAWNTLDSQGHLHEVLAGDYFHPEVQSVPEQTWSSAGYLSAAVHGLLGIAVHAAAHRLTFAPRLPASWQRLSLAHLKVGASTLQLRMTAGEQGIELHVENTGAPVTIAFRPEVPLGAAITSATVNGLSTGVSTKRFPQEEDADVQFQAGQGITTCRIAYRGGVTLSPEWKQPSIGGQSRNLRIAGATLSRHELHIAAYVRDAGPETILLRTPWKPQAAPGVTLKDAGPDLYRLHLQERPPDTRAGGGYHKREVSIRLVPPAA
jgi:glycogen debranching enzyme